MSFRMSKGFMFSAASIFVWLLVLGTNYIVQFWPSAIMLTVFVTVSFFITISGSVIRYGVAPYFLASVLLFFCANIILWPIATNSPYEFYSLINMIIDERLFDYAAALVGLSLSLTLSSYFFFINIPRANVCSEKFNKIVSNIRSVRLSKIGSYLIFGSFPLLLFSYVFEFKQLLNLGYLSLYSEGLQAGVTTPIWTGVAQYVFYGGLGLVLAFSNDRRTLKIALFIFLMVSFVNSLKGGRSSFIVPCLFAFWLYSSTFSLRVKLRYILLLGSVVAVFFVVLTVFRDNVESGFDIVQFSIDSLASQARSLQLVAIYLLNSDEVGRYGNFMVFSNLFLPINILINPELRDLPQSIAQVTYSNNLKHILTYVLNPDYYFMGGGVGGVYVIELIEAGLVLYIALSVFAGWFIAKLPELMSRPIVRFVSLQIFSLIYFMPRAEFFPNALILLKSILLYYLLCYLSGVLWPHSGVSIVRNSKVVYNKV
jgi:hypothetical protein